LKQNFLGHSVLALCTTWTDTWVGRTEEFKIEPLHVWVAVLMWTKGIPGKYLFIYDSNSDRLSRDEEVTGKKLLGKQQALHKGVA
jgi:hypothetical protein